MSKLRFAFCFLFVQSLNVQVSTVANGLPKLVYLQYSIALYTLFWPNKRNRAACYCQAYSSRDDYKSSNRLLICCKLFQLQLPHPIQRNANLSAECSVVVACQSCIRGPSFVCNCLREAFAMGKR